METTDTEVPSVKDIQMMAWSKFKMWIYKRLTSEGSNEKNSTPVKIRVISVISVIQVLLGFLGIVLALVGLVAAFSVRERCRQNFSWRLEVEISKYYEQRIKNLTHEALTDRRVLQRYYENKLLPQNMNKTKAERSFVYGGDPFVPTPTYTQYKSEDSWYSRPYRNLNDGFRYDAGDRCIEDSYLIVDYLGIPAWTGILALVAGLVGCRATHHWATDGFASMNAGYMMLNIICIFIFAPGMLASSIFQMVTASRMYSDDFRYIVAAIACGVASVIMFISIIPASLCCCCPALPPLGHYKVMSEEVLGHPDTKDKPRDNDSAIDA